MVTVTSGETLDIETAVTEAVSVECRIGGPQASNHAMLPGNPWTVQIDTTGFTAGTYAFQCWATYSGGVKRIVMSGSFGVRAALAGGQDVRSTARKNVEAIEAMLGGTASKGVRRYKIGERELEKYSVAELLKLLSFWTLKLAKEEREALGRPKLGPRIAIRF